MDDICDAPKVYYEHGSSFGVLGKFEEADFTYIIQCYFTVNRPSKSKSN